VVENQTDEDWNDVRMALISGRPISFQMNLYDSLFIKRPVVEPELFASLRPVTYSGGLGVDLPKSAPVAERAFDDTLKDCFAKFPLLGLIFKNTTGMHLTQGPITVYEGSTYSGDARILDLQKDERRLLSYAIDLETEVQAVPHSDNGRITSVKVVKGIAYTTT